MIPIFISDDGDADTALKSSNFDTVCKVVRALRSHEVLGQELDQLRVKLGRERASGNINLTLNYIQFDLHETSETFNRTDCFTNDVLPPSDYTGN